MANNFKSHSLDLNDCINVSKEVLQVMPSQAEPLQSTMNVASSPSVADSQVIYGQPGQVSTFQNHFNDGPVHKNDHRNDANNVKFNNKKFAKLVTELEHAQDLLAKYDRDKRLMQNEIDQLKQEISDHELIKAQMAETRMRLEENIARLSEKNEADQSKMEEMQNELNKIQKQLDQAKAQLAIEQANSEKNEAARLVAEKVTAELKIMCEEHESLLRNQLKKESTLAQERLITLEKHLDDIISEKQAANQMNRKLNKRIKELVSQVDEQKRALVEEQNKSRKATERIKVLLDHVDQLEEERWREATSKRMALRDLDSAKEMVEDLTRQLKKQLVQSDDKKVISQVEGADSVGKA